MGTVIAEPDVKKEVTTKEELDDLRIRLAEWRKRQAKTPSAEQRKGKPYGREDDLDGLAVFLEDLKQVMTFLVNHRVLQEQRRAFTDYLPEIDVRIDIAIAKLRSIDNDDNALYVGLHNAGLTGNRLSIKLREYWRRIKHSPVVAVLKMADTILGSLFPILTELEPVKEFKEVLESKLEYDGDADLQLLNISGREGAWRRSEWQP